ARIKGLVKNGITEVLVKTPAKESELADLRVFDKYVAIEQYKDKQGVVFLDKAEALTVDSVARLMQHGHQRIAIGPATPTEIVCAQLCGNNHYSMRATMKVVIVAAELGADD